MYRKNCQAVFLPDSLKARERVEGDAIRFHQYSFVLADAVLHFTDARMMGASGRSIRRRLALIASSLLLVETPANGRLGEALETKLRVLAQPTLCDGGPSLHSYIQGVKQRVIDIEDCSLANLVDCIVDAFDHIASRFVFNPLD